MGPLTGLTILIAEDEFLIGLNLQLILEEAGATVIGPFPTSDGAMRALSDISVSAAILDFRLGRSTSEGIARRLAAHGIPFIFYTGQTVPTTLTAPVLEKPVSDKVLIAAIRRLTGRAVPP